MFIGGTSWGFMNGANVQGSVPTYSPDVTSYGEYCNGVNCYIIFSLVKKISVFMIGIAIK